MQKRRQLSTLALALVFVMVFASVAGAVTVPTNIYYTDPATSQVVGADYGAASDAFDTGNTAMWNALKQGLLNAIRAGKSVVVETATGAINYLDAALAGKTLDEAAQDPTFSTTAPTPTKELKPDGTVGDPGPTAVTVTAITAIADKNVENGTELSAVGLPAKVELSLSNNTKVEAAVAWDGGTPAYNATVAATYAFSGTVTVPEGVEATTLKASVNVVVAAPVGLAVSSVSAITNTVVDVKLTTAATSANASQFTIKDASDNAIAVNSAELSSDGKTITLMTAAQTTGTVYTLTTGSTSKTFVGGVVDSAAPTAVSATSKTNTSVEVTFTDANRLDVTSATNAANYEISGLTITNATVSGKVVTLTTSAQTAGSVYTVSVNNVKDVAGNAITSALTSSFAGKGADTTAPASITATSYNNTKVVVTFNEDVDPTTATTLANYTIAGLTPTAVDFVATAADATLYGATKDRSVVLTTPAQTVGTVYTVSVTGVKDTSDNAITTAITSTFAGKGADTTAPTVASAAAYNNTKVVVTFNENVEATSAQTVANYAIAGLTPTEATLITTAADATMYSGTANRSVVLTTPAQTAGTVYTVSVTGVKDTSDNAITTASTATFAGKTADTTAPTISSVTALQGNKLQIVFSEAMDSTSVQTLTNYSISTLGYPVSVDSWTASTNTLVLNTATQSNGVVYTLTTTGVKDTSGNTIAANTTNTFAGIGTALDAPALSSVTALDNQRIKVVFNKDMDSTSVAITDFVLYKGSGSTTDTLADNTGESITKISNSEYIIFLGTAAADKLTSDVYKLKVTGAMTDLGGTALSTADATKNEKTFGGVDTAALTPAIVSLTQTDARTLVATFNQEMTTLALAAVGNVTVTYESTTINSAATTAPAVDSTVKTKVTFKFASDIAANKVAKLNILAADFSKFKDITGNIAMVKNAETNYEVQFGTQEFTATTLKLSSVTAVDEQTLELAFNTPIIFNSGSALTNPGTGTDANFMVITKNSDGGAVTHDLKYAEQTADTKVRVYFTNTGMAEGTIYKLAITDNAAGDDLFVKASDGTTALDASVTANATATFGYNATANAAPYLVSATPLSDTVVQLTFSESLSADPAQTTNLVFKNGANTFAAGSIAIADLGTDKKVFKATLTNGVFLSGTTYTIEVVSGALTDKYGVDALKATNGTTVPHVTFGGAASALGTTMTVPAITGADNLQTGLVMTFGTNLHFVTGGVVTELTDADHKAHFTKTGTVTLTSGTYATAGNTVTWVLAGSVTDDTIAVTADTLYDAAGNKLVPANFTVKYNATADFDARKSLKRVKYSSATHEFILFFRMKNELYYRKL